MTNNDAPDQSITRPAAAQVSVAEHVLKFMPPALIVASDPGARQGISWIANQFAQDGILPEGLTMRGAIILILAGIDYNLSPIEAISKLYLIGGRVTPSAHELAAQAIRAGIKMEVLESTNEIARVRFSRDGHADLEYTYTKENANKAGLWGKRGPWSNDPRSMLMARCKSQGLRIYAPDTLSSLYDADEVSGGTGYIDPQGNFTPDPSITGDQPKTKVKPFVGLDDTEQKEVAVPAPRVVKTVEAAPAADDDDVAPEPAPPAAPKPVHTPKAAAPKPAPAPKAAKTAQITENVSVAVEETGQRLEDKPVTTTNKRAMLDGVAQAVAKQFGRVEGVALLRGRIAELGHQSSTDLSDLEVVGLVKWVDDQIKADKLAKAASVAEDTQPESPEHIPDFDPQRGSGTRTKTDAVSAAAPANYDEQIMNVFYKFSETDKDDDFGEIIAETGYDETSSSQQVKKLTLDLLIEKLASY